LRQLLRRELVPLSISLLATLILLGLRFGVDTTRYFKADVSAVSAYVTALGTLYSILAAFTIYVVWNQFNDTQNAIDGEAKDLADLYRYVGYLNDRPAASGFRKAIEAYISAVVGDEWPKIARGQRESKPANVAFEAIYQEVSAIKFDDERDEAVWSMIIRKYEDVSDIPLKRLDLATSRIPVVLNLLLYAVSVGLVAGFFMLSIENDLLAIVTTFLTTVIVVMVLDTVSDIDNPFGGEFAITPTQFIAVGETLSAPDEAISAVGSEAEAVTTSGQSRGGGFT
jgi:hypothetical protein